MNNKVPNILLKYDYSEYSGRTLANADDIVFAMLDFVCDHFMHDGNVRLPRNHSMVGIIEGSEKIGLKTNCRGLSLILAELLRMNGIKARQVTCKPYEEPFSDCHVVVDCIMPSGKRIMLDPTYRLYFLDDLLPDMKTTEIELIPKGYTTERFAKRIKFVTDPNSFWNI